ncbi:MAG: hypothetical protein HYX35_04510 [Proteobacteria bacterium]|nr:hypothetical protein [Pseudomonadota bacterium]
MSKRRSKNLKSLLFSTAVGLSLGSTPLFAHYLEEGRATEKESAIIQVKRAYQVDDGIDTVFYKGQELIKGEVIGNGDCIIESLALAFPEKHITRRNIVERMVAAFNSPDAAIRNGIKQELAIRLWDEVGQQALEVGTPQLSGSKITAEMQKANLAILDDIAGTQARFLQNDALLQEVIEAHRSDSVFLSFVDPEYHRRGILGTLGWVCQSYGLNLEVLRRQFLPRHKGMRADERRESDQCELRDRFNFGGDAPFHYGLMSAGGGHMSPLAPLADLDMRERMANRIFSLIHLGKDRGQEHYKSIDRGLSKIDSRLRHFIDEAPLEVEVGGGAGPATTPLRKELVDLHVAGMRNHFKGPTENFLDFKTQIEANTIQELRDERAEVLAAIAILEQEWFALPPLKQELVDRHVAGMRDHFKGPTENFLDFKTQVQSNNLPPEAQAERPELLAAIAILEQEWGEGTVPTHPETIDSDLVEIIRQDIDETIRRTKAPFIVLKEALERAPTDPNTKQAVHGFLPLLTSPKERQEINILLGRVPNEGLIQLAPKVVRNPDEDTQTVADIQTGIHAMLDNGDDPALVLRRTLDLDPTNPHVIQAVRSFLLLLEDSDPTRQEIEEIIARAERAGPAHFPLKDQSAPPVNAAEEQIQRRVATGESLGMILRDMLTTSLGDDPSVIQAVTAYLPQLTRPHEQESKTQIAQILDALRESAAHAEPEIPGAHRMHTLTQADLLQDWITLGLIKTNPIDVHPDQKLTVRCTFDHPATEPTAIAFLNSAQNGYYEGGAVIQPGQTSVTFTSVVPQGEERTWLVIRNPGFNAQNPLTLGVQISKVLMDIEEGTAQKLPLVKEFENLGLMKTNPIDVQQGQRLTVRCTFDHPATEPTAIAFLNSAQNGYYEGGAVVQPGQTSVTFTSVVPQGEERTWLVIRNPAFDGKSPLPLGVRMSNVFLDVEEERK